MIDYGNKPTDIRSPKSQWFHVRNRLRQVIYNIKFVERCYPVESDKHRRGLNRRKRLVIRLFHRRNNIAMILFLGGHDKDFDKL
jgi:hypothetical protein